TFIGKSKDVKELEENWKRLITKFVEISRKFEPYMSEYLREDYDIGNSEHTGLVGWLTERAFNKALKWLYEAKYRDLNPEPNWLNPSWLLNKETELVEKEIKFAIELRPYVEAAHLMRIDPFNPAYSGVWWFYVDGFMAKERPYAVYPAGFFVSEKALKQHLKNQATLFVDLLTKPSASMNGAAAIQFMVYAGRIEQIESYFKKYNGLDTEFIGVLSYFAQEHIFNKIQGSGDCGPVSDFTGAINCNAGLSFDGPLPDAKPLQRGKPSALAILMPYVSELLYGDAERLRMRQTDSDKEGIENENLVKSLLNLIDEWNGRKNGKVNRRQAWDWSAFYGWEKLDKDGKPTGIITNGIPAGNEVTADAPEGRYGYILNQTLLAQIQVTLKIAQQIKEKVAELLGVERLDFNNPEHWKFLIKKAHEVYISARNTALDWENEGRIPTLRYWTPDLALLEDDLSSVTNPIFEKVNYKRTIFNQLPLRSAHLKTGEWLLPQFKDEWRIQALILPYLKEKDKELKLDALLTHSLLKNYFLISKDLGKEIVLDKIKEEEILERGLSIFKEKNSIDILPTISDAELLRLFREEIFALGKEAIIKENFDRAYIEGIKEAYRRLVGKEIDIPRESIETKDNFISRELANYLEKNGYNPTEQDEKDTFNFWSAIYDKLVSLYQERFYFQAEKYAQEAFKQIINSFQFGFYMKWDEVKNTYLVNKRALPFDERRKEIEDWIKKLQKSIPGINLENFLNYWINYVLEGINFLGYSPLVALRMANDTMKVPASIIIVPGGGAGSGTPSTAPTTPPTTPQTPTTTAQVSITQAPVITAAFDYFGMGWSFTWGEVKGRDNKGKEIPLEYEWEVLDSQGKVLRKGITEGLSVLVDFFAGNLFRVRAIYRENGAILAQSPWAEY
ncbi:MAG: hypothetical protein NC920_04880, partial [Candidatus Omnitrophica bacterium]|nr:hypothetical protein [Candidatus Omnitrophota bacterium]